MDVRGLSDNPKSLANGIGILAALSDYVLVFCPERRVGRSSHVADRKRLHSIKLTLNTSFATEQTHQPVGSSPIAVDGVCVLGVSGSG